ncbi:MAG TPA: hypothetical protein VGG02_13820 [Chthoniobacterales bacterium]|jgi:hypothetical protein
MEFVFGLPYEEAIQKLGERSPLGSLLTSAQWANVPVALRERAFFSATVESARWLTQARQFLNDSLANTTALNENGERYFVAGGRSQFIEQLQTKAIALGLGPLDPDDAGTIEDIRSATRLALVYDTNLQSAQGYGNWKESQDSDLLDAFPSSRFVRVKAVRKPRPLHQAHLNEVRRKDDLKFYLQMNSRSIGGFGVPWPPFGFRSGMGLQDVGRAESDKLGLTTPNETIQPVEKDFNDNLQASTQNLDPKLVGFLKAAFGDRAKFEDDAVSWNVPNNGDSDQPNDERRNDDGE